MKKIRYPCYIIVSRQECKYYYTTSSQTVGGLKMTECHFPSLCGGFLSAGYVTLIALLGFAFSM